MSDIHVHDNRSKQRYEIHDGEQLIGFAAYRLSDAAITFTHTEINPAFEGHGYGKTLVQTMLDDVRANTTTRVIASCPFVAAFIRRHPAYEDLLSR